MERREYIFSPITSEDMRPMGADCEVELEQELVRRDVFGVAGAAILSAHLTELTRPEREEDGAAVVGERSIEGASGMIEAGAGIPALRELILAEAIGAE